MTVEVTATFALGVLAFVVSLLNFLYTRFSVEIRHNERTTALEVKVSILMAVLDGQLKSLGMLVKAPTHHRMDYLIDRFEAGETSIREMYELRERLEEYQEELQADYAERKTRAVADGQPLPDGARILATTLFLAMVRMRLHEHEAEKARTPFWNWRRWFASA